MAQEDYAILVGISRYADAGLPELKGPVRDVELMYKWLVDSNGGNVPPENVTCLVTNEAKIGDPPPFPPILTDFVGVLNKILFKPDQSMIRRPAGRLYLYFSGHGFCERTSTTPEAALYVADSTRSANWNISGTEYARRVRDHGAFGEIVLVMDCCRDAELYKMAFPPTLRLAADPALAQGVKLFELYATSRGGKAQERPIRERDNKVHGLLTHALLRAFDHAAPDLEQLSSRDIKGYIQENWSALCDGQPADLPEIVTPTIGEVTFGRPAPQDVPQGFKVVSVVDGASFTIRSGIKLGVLAKFTITGGEVHVVRNGLANNIPVVDGRFVVPLPASLCVVWGVSGGSAIEKDFQVGAADVDL
ncbi:MAG: caspase family protein [Myxococcales bacterium]